MKGRWKEVLETFASLPEVRKEKITKSEDIALYIAIADGQTKVAFNLVEKVDQLTKAYQTAGVFHKRRRL